MGILNVVGWVFVPRNIKSIAATIANAAAGTAVVLTGVASLPVTVGSGVAVHCALNITLNNTPEEVERVKDNMRAYLDAQRLKKAANSLKKAADKRAALVPEPDMEKHNA